MASRNHREGRYVGKLAASYGHARLHYRSHLALPVGPASAAVALLTRSSWLILPDGPGWQLSSPRRSKLTRSRRRGTGTAWPC